MHIASSGSGLVPAYTLRVQLEEAQKELALFRSGLTASCDALLLAQGLMSHDHDAAVHACMEAEGMGRGDAIDAVWEVLGTEEQDEYLERARDAQDAIRALNAE